MWVDRINVHEMAHSYFGDAVVCRDSAHAWLKESWATYIDQCWQEDNLGQDEALYTFFDNANQYFKEADERYKRPIVTRRFRSSWQLYDAHLYPGGACRLHTLRNELGDQVFWAAVRDYLKRYQGKVVETDDFRRVLEEHSGRALGKFFDQWFHSSGYPSLKVAFTFDDERKQGTFEIEQTQVDTEKSIPAFALSTDLAWTIDGVGYSVPIALQEAKHVVTVPMAARPEQVRFDPGCKVLHKLEFNPGDPMLRAQLTAAKDVIGRVQAARELAKTGKQANVQAIVDAYVNETFWGAREQFAQALGEANTEAAVEGMAQIIGLEKEPRVLASVFQAARNYRDPRVRDAVAARLEDGCQPEHPQGLPYIATAAAYEALGKQRREARWDLLVEGVQRDSFNGYAQSGAFRGLAGTRRDEAIELLMEKATYGATSNRARPAAVAALADIGQGQEKAVRERIVEKLVDLLRDPWDRVGWSAAFGLKTLKAPEAMAALQAYARTLSHQERVAVERMVKALREEDKVDGSALKKQVEELQEKMRKLEDQLQKLQARVEPPARESSA